MFKSFMLFFLACFFTPYVCGGAPIICMESSGTAAGLVGKEWEGPFNSLSNASSTSPIHFLSSFFLIGCFDIEAVFVNALYTLSFSWSYLRRMTGFFSFNITCFYKSSLGLKGIKIGKLFSLKNVIIKESFVDFANSYKEYFPVLRSVFTLV